MPTIDPENAVMVNPLRTLKPVNRHLVIIPHKKQNETESGVLLPENFVRDENEHRYITATVIAAAADCSIVFQRLNNRSGEERLIVIDEKMIEDVVLDDKTYYIILENYVVGILRGLNED
jgi:co-chaperonin GroES (HSP10)